ncbi:MAG: alpha/beta fold hydrolase [Candidatus Binatia bacterium]
MADRPVTHSASPQDVTEGRARTRDGAQISYAVYGARSGTPRVALVHSLAMDRHFWRPVVERLAGKASVLVYDCRGHGASDKPAGPYAVERFADDLADLLDHVGWETALVAGASMGGCVALAFGAAYPARAAALGLVDTTAWYGPDAPKQWAERADRALQAGLAPMVEFQTTRWFGDAFRAEHPDIVADCVRAFLRNDLQAYAATCHMLGACDLRAALPRLRMPAAVLVGEEDYATPVAMAAALQSEIPGAQLTVLPGARHLTPLERPERIAAALCRLLEVTEWSPSNSPSRLR